MKSRPRPRLVALIAALSLAGCGGTVDQAKNLSHATTLDDAKAQSLASGRPILVDIYADW